MKNRDLISSIVWMAFGGLFVVGALDQGLTHKGALGPGFLPFLTGLSLILVSFFVLVPALASRGASPETKASLSPEDRKRVLLAMGALFLFGFLVEYAGYLLSTILFMLSVSRLMVKRSWKMTISVALATAALSYLLFVVFLEVPLPEGLPGLLLESIKGGE